MKTSGIFQVLWSRALLGRYRSLLSQREPVVMRERARTDEVERRQRVHYLPLRAAPAADQPVIEAAAGSEPVTAAPLESLLAPALSSRTRAAVAAAPPALRAGLILGSPDFMRR